MKDFFKKFTLKAKIIIGAIIGIATLVLYTFMMSRQDPKSLIQYQLNRLISQRKITELEEKDKAGLKKVEQLKKEEEILRKRLEELEKLTPEERVNIQDLDNFFDQRGF